MKRKLTLFTAALLVCYLGWQFGNTPDTSNSESQKASFAAIKCTVAKFLLDDVDTTRQIAPLFENLGNLHYPISTTNKKAQAFFDQGLRLTYAFNHAEAHRSFMEAARLDPSAAMAYWGQAFALGPNINDTQPDEDRRIKAHEAVTRASELSDKASKKEKALIMALSKRYSADPAAELEPLNTAYMEAMATVAANFPKDADVQTLYADAVMNTTPWMYWDNAGNPAIHTPAAKKALELAMELQPDHPGAHHMYIHMVELPFPDLAVPSADKLGNLMPAAGHLVHMPSHIYIRVGRYQDAVKANEDAILADEDYISQCYSQGMYPLGYYPHNIHFLWSAASLLGASDLAIEAAQKTAEKVPVGELNALPFLQDFASTPLLAYVRFGKWNDILTVPPPNAEIKHLKLIWHYARGIAFIRKDNLKEAAEELEALRVLKEDDSLKDFMGSFQNSTGSIAQVAHAVVAGELAAAQGDLKKAALELRNAVALEDQLIYSEPPAWYIPTRQNLGAVLMQDADYAAAEKVYREDLERLRQNGWSLMGLYQSLKLQGKEAEANKVKEEYDRAWSDADIEIEKSVL